MIPALSGALICAVALATAAHAQTPPGRAESHSEAAMKARHDAMRQQQLEDLKVVLRLRPDQEPALAAFAAALEPRRIERRLPAAEDAPLTTPQRLEAMAKHEAEMRAQHERMRQALADLYAALSPEQRLVFDAVQRLREGGPMSGVHDGPAGPHGRSRVIIRRHGPMDGPPAADGPH